MKKSSKVFKKTIKYKCQNFVFESVFLFAIIFSNVAFSWENPGWGNAALVCENPRIGGDSPDLGFKEQKNTFGTGFYHIAPLPDQQQRVLGVNNDTGQVGFLTATTLQSTDWLVTLVGTDLYQISICHLGKPRCLILSDNQTPILGACNHQAYGSQAWWSVGILNGPGKGGSMLGSDAIGRMDCLTEDPDEEFLILSACETSGEPDVTWQLTPVNTNSPKQKKRSLVGPVNTTAYQCETGETVQATFDETNEEIQVYYQKNLLTLVPVISGSGAKFGGTSVPWGWWMKGNEGYIFSYHSDGTEGQIIERCFEISNTVAADIGSSESVPELDSDRSWATQGVGEHITLTDCNDCGDDIGMMIVCQGAGNPALASVNWLATTATTPDTVMTIEASGTTYEREVYTRNNGMLGLVPLFSLKSGDPVVKALKESSYVKFTYGDVTTHIGLQGSKFAFEIFDAHCRWKKTENNVPLSPAPAPHSIVPDEAIWHTSKYIDEETSKEKSDLFFGIPETDNTALVASCDRDASTAEINLLLNSGAYKDGSVVNVHFKTGTFNHTYQGQVFFIGDESAGVNFMFSIVDPLWSALELGAPLQISPQSGTGFELKSSKTVGGVKKWIQHCRRNE
ncbi:MliC family protein [uncultured Kiloniella sp.]|uniref:MliC family protein n=1 Tax=uncultured Kiloniella sp. TaxID=1133091 RepID=UPI002604FD81|nr:MliC family protein [uncultured Kiloniella sp.]